MYLYLKKIYENSLDDGSSVFIRTVSYGNESFFSGHLPIKKRILDVRTAHAIVTYRRRCLSKPFPLFDTYNAPIDTLTIRSRQSMDREVEKTTTT